MFANSAAVARRAGAVLALGGLGLLVSATGASAGSVGGSPVPVLQSGTNGCQGVRDTPGSANTTKTLVGGSMQPGGSAVFSITYPFDADDLGQTFTITDCVFIGGEPAQKYSITFVPNSTAYTFDYALVIPADTPLGTEYCNYAKTTDGPSASPASNRKASGACFNIGGSLRIEKRSGSTAGDLLPGAQFDVLCDVDASAQPPLVVEGLDENGVATTGVIAINGPEGTACEITEVAAPDGYDLPADATTDVTIPRGDEAETVVIVNTETVTGGCPDGTVDDGEGGCVTPTEEPTEEPTDEPTEEPSVDPSDPVVEPTDPEPTVSPTVKGVKIVKPTKPTLPETGAASGLLLAAGLGLIVLGGGLVVRGNRYARQH